MRMVRDRSGRFPQRPHWAIGELERKCEEAIIGLLIQRYGFERIAVPTEALMELVHWLGADLLFQDQLSDHKYDIFGYTDFREKQPLVVIATELMEQHRRNNRLRMTLAHECSHVLLHTWLYARYGAACSQQVCYWKDLLPHERVTDWMEWQAGYGGGGLLMPESFIRRTVAAYCRERRVEGPFKKSSPAGATLIDRAALTFEVSTEAAMVRLAKLAYLID
jgi:Zn-dependent peptidase ImmA (M78 family)